MHLPATVLSLRKVLLLVAALSIVACGESLTPSELLSRANAALGEGRDSAALIDVRAAQQQAPDNLEARRLLAEIEMWRQNPDAAVEEVERALQDGPANVDILVTYAKALVQSRRYSDFDVLLSDGTFTPASRDPRFLAQFARAQASWGDQEQARATVLEAFTLADSDPDVVTAYALLNARNDMTFGDVLSLLTNTANEHPYAYEVWSTIGILQVALDEYSEAIKAFSKSLAVNPYRSTDYYLMADAMIRSRQFDEALKTIQTLNKLAANSPQVYYLRAQWHIAQNQYEEAIDSISNVLSIAPKNPRAVLLSAIANSALGNLETARRQWLILESLDAYQPQTSLRLAGVLAELDETAASETRLREILKEDPMNLGAKRLLAAVLAAQGMNAESATLYEALLVAEPGSTQNLINYSATLSESGERAKAIEQLKAARALQPESSDILAVLTTLLLAENRGAEAAQEVRGFLDKYPEKASAHALVGRVAQATGDASANQHYERALELEPGNQMANSGLAEIALARGDQASAINYYKAILGTDENDLETLMRIAAVQASTQNFAAMEVTLKSAVEAHPSDVRPRLSLARYYVSSQRYNDAVRLLGTFTEKGKEDTRVYTLLAGSYMALGETSSAVSVAERMQKLRPENPEGYILEARALGRARKLGAATDALREALKVNKDVAIRKELITALLLDGKPDLAREVFDAAADGDFNDASYALTDGQIKAGANQLDAAASAFKKAYSLAPNQQAAALTAKTYWRSDNQEAAIEVLNDWLKRDPDSTAVLSQLSGYLLERGDNAAALPLLQTLNENAPGQASVLNNLAWATLEIDAKQSLAWAKQAREIAPNDHNVQDTLSLALAANGDAERALELNDELLKKAPANTSFVVSHARILDTLGETRQAIQLLDSLIARNGDVGGAQALRDKMAVQ